MANKKRKRLGHTKPRLSNAPIKGKSRVDEVAKLAEQIGMPLLPWQHHVLEDMLKIDSKGNFQRKSNLCLVARQSGKTHLARMRVLAGLFIFREKNILMMSSNRGMALTSFREIASVIESHDFLNCQVKAIRYANGTESIELLPEFGGCRLDVVAATRDGSRGRTADFLWIDELREIDEQAFIAATPVTRARPNSQSLFTSNAGDNFSKVLNDMRNRAQEYPPKELGYWEYSAPQYCKIDLNSEEFWDAIAMANPALNYTITEQAITETIAMSTVESIRTETLCSWIDALSSPWPMGILEETSDSELQMSPGAYTIFGFDVSPSKRNASLTAGQILPDGRIGIGILETYYSDSAVDDLKIAASIKAWCDIYRPKLVCHDKYTTATIAERLSNAGVKIQDVSGQNFYRACSDYLDSLVNHRVVHSGQESFIEQMNNCAAKESDHGWRIIRRRSAGDVSAPISLAMVVSTLMKPQSKAEIIIA